MSWEAKAKCNASEWSHVSSYLEMHLGQEMGFAEDGVKQGKSVVGAKLITACPCGVGVSFLDRQSTTKASSTLGDPLSTYASTHPTCFEAVHLTCRRRIGIDGTLPRIRRPISLSELPTTSILLLVGIIGQVDASRTSLRFGFGDKDCCARSVTGSSRCG